MIKLRNKDNKYQEVYGTTGLSYQCAAKQATGKTRSCKTVKQAMSACAYSYLEASLMAGYNTLHTVEDKNRKDVIVNIPLPPAISDAVKVIEATCKQYGRNF